MIELTAQVTSTSSEVHPLLKELRPNVQEYMDILNNMEGNSHVQNNLFVSASPVPHGFGMGNIHKLIWNHQAAATNSGDFIDMQSIWNEIHLPILKNFYSLKLSILKHHKILNDNDYKKLRENVNCIVELRKLNNKYHKFLKKATDFYYSCLLDFMDVYYNLFEKNQYLSSELLQRFKEEGIIIGNNFNSESPSFQNIPKRNGYADSENSGNNNAGTEHFSSQHLFKKPLLFQSNYVTLDTFSDLTIEAKRNKILACIYNICINIATLSYYSAIMETMNYKIQQFSRVLKWSTLGQFFENYDNDTDSNQDFSRHHFLKSSVYFKCDCYGYAVVCLLRNEQRQQTSTGEAFAMINNMLDINGDQYKKILSHLKKLDYMNKDKGNRLIINKEIIEEYFLYCWNDVLQKNLNETSFSSVKPDYHYRFEVLKEKISIRYKKNILPIYINILLCFSGALFLKNVNKVTKHYYKFCCDYIVFVMGNAILKEFQNFLMETNNAGSGNNGKNYKTFQNHYQYLAFVRVFLQFVYNDNEFFKVVIENKELVRVLATFVNLCGEFDPELLVNYAPQFTGQKKNLKEFYSKPKRNFLYQEDLELLHWKDLNLNDFSNNSKTAHTKKTFLNYELLDEERSIMDIPVSKFKSKLEAIINRIIPIVNEFNSQTTMASDRFKIINGRYCTNSNDILDFNLLSKDELFNSFSVSNANIAGNGTSSYPKGKLQRSSRPHSSIAARESSNSPNLFKMNSNTQRSYSNGSPTGGQNSAPFWKKRNSTSASSSPTKDTENSENLDLTNSSKPKISQRAFSQPSISAPPKMERNKYDANNKSVNNSIVVVGSESDTLSMLMGTDVKSPYPEQAHTPSSTRSNHGSYPPSHKNDAISSPATQSSMNSGTMNPSMFMSWDSNIANNNMSSVSAGIDYGLNFGPHQTSNQQFNSAAYTSSFGGNSQPVNNIGSSNLMGFGTNTYSNANSMSQQSQYSNVINAMNNFSFGQSSSQSQHSLKPSVSVQSLNGLIRNGTSSNSNNAYSSNLPFINNDANLFEQNSKHSLSVYNTNSNGNMSTSDQNTASENSPKKDMIWMESNPYNTQQNQVSAVSSNSIWDNNHVAPQPNSQMSIQNVSQFNQFLVPSMNNSSTNHQSNGSFSLHQNGNSGNYTPPGTIPSQGTYQFSGFTQQRPSSTDHSMFRTQGSDSDANNVRFDSIQRSGSTGWYNNL